MNEFEMEVERLYNEWLEKTERQLERIKQE